MTTAHGHALDPSFILNDEAKLIAGKVAQGTPMVESLREYLALTIAVVGATEHGDE